MFWYWLWMIVKYFVVSLITVVAFLAFMVAVGMSPFYVGLSFWIVLAIIGVPLLVFVLGYAGLGMMAEHDDEHEY